MTQAVKGAKLTRLEDFVQAAKQGKQVRVELDLRKQLVKQSVHPEETDDMSEERDMYLLTGDYAVTGIEGHAQSVSKVYVFGSLCESPTEAEVNRHIANERLKMDYHRLKNAGIPVEEKYF